MLINCPKCGLECEGEAIDKPWISNCICDCGFEFDYDTLRDEYCDMDGNIIKERKMNDKKVLESKIVKEFVALCIPSISPENMDKLEDVLKQLIQSRHLPKNCGDIKLNKEAKNE